MKIDGGISQPDPAGVDAGISDGLDRKTAAAAATTEVVKVH